MTSMAIQAGLARWCAKPTATTAIFWSDSDAQSNPGKVDTRVCNVATSHSWVFQLRTLENVSLSSVWPHPPLGVKCCQPVHRHCWSSLWSRLWCSSHFSTFGTGSCCCALGVYGCKTWHIQREGGQYDVPDGQREGSGGDGGDGCNVCSE